MTSVRIKGTKKAYHGLRHDRNLIFQKCRLQRRCRLSLCSPRANFYRIRLARDYVQEAVAIHQLLMKSSYCLPADLGKD